MIDDANTMEVIVGGKAERRPIACIRYPDGGFVGAAFPPMPEPVLRCDEIAVLTICGQTHILPKGAA